MGPTTHLDCRLMAFKGQALNYKEWSVIIICPFSIHWRRYSPFSDHLRRLPILLVIQLTKQVSATDSSSDFIPLIQDICYPLGKLGQFINAFKSSKFSNLNRMICLISLKDIHVLVNSFIPLSILAPLLVATNNSQPQVVFINILIDIPFIIRTIQDSIHFKWKINNRIQSILKIKIVGGTNKSNFKSSKIKSSKIKVVGSANKSNFESLKIKSSPSERRTSVLV